MIHRIFFLLILLILVGSKISFAYDTSALLKHDGDTKKHPSSKLDSSLGFGLFVKRYDYCKTWSDVKFSVNQIKKDIRKISKADGINFNLGFNRYSQPVSTCNLFKSQMGFDKGFDLYFRLLKIASDEKLGILPLPQISVDEICDKATEKTAIGKIIWSDHPVSIKYKQEAERRGLVCGVKKVDEFYDWEDVDICRMAVITDGFGNKKWNDGLYRFVKEAKSRGLDCGIKNTNQSNKKIIFID